MEKKKIRDVHAENIKQHDLFNYCGKIPPLRPSSGPIICYTPPACKVRLIKLHIKLEKNTNIRTLVQIIRILIRLGFLGQISGFRARHFYIGNFIFYC